MAMQNLAAVPMRIDALWSDGTTGLAPPSEDYTQLGNSVPVGGNASNSLPWLGESIDVPSNEAEALPAGLHLHWTLPRALRRGASVYVITHAVLNELVQQGMPCSLVAALQAAVTLDQEYDQQGLLAILNRLAASGGRTPLPASAFALAPAPTSYPGLISSDASIAVATIAPALQWDAILLEVYGQAILHAATQMKLPPVPDRWLVVRTDAAGGGATAWVVESDRLTAPNADGTAPAGAGPRAIPAQFAKALVDGFGNVTAAQTFDYLGLVTAASRWSESAAKPRLAPFTAVGPGAVDFAAFYPNCQGVFGFHDASAEAIATYVYSVIGWFADAANDPLASAYAVAPWAAGTTPEARAQSLGWIAQGADWSTLQGSVYAARIAATGNACAAQPDADLPQDQVTVAIGNSAGEALSAFLARGTSGNVAGLSAQSALNAAQTGVLDKVLGADGPAVIENMLHQASFETIGGGSIWQVAARPPAAKGLSTTPQSGNIVLSDAMADALNALNTAQMAFDRACGRQQSERALLFADWCRALHLDTDASGSGLNPPFPNGTTIGNANVQLSTVAGQYLLWQAADAIRKASRDDATPGAMAPFGTMAELYLAYAAALTALAQMPGGGGLCLRRQPAPRYFRPNDPVVMLTEASGDDLVASPADTLPTTEVDDVDYLALSLYAAGRTPACLPSGWDAIPGVPAAAWIGGALAALPATQAAQSWRPLSLQWEALYYSYPGTGTITAASPSAGPFTVTDYDATFIGENFTPDPDGVDLAPKTGAKPDLSQSARYAGRVVLSGHAQQTMRQRILQLCGQRTDPPATSAGLALPGILASDPAKSLIQAAYDSAVPTLAQALNGFNDQLLMLRRISQVSKFAANYQTASWQTGTNSSNPAFDADSQSFFDEIGIQTRASPDQDAIYNPIRAGECTLDSLVLVDAFGQRRRWQAAAQSANTVIADSFIDLTGSDGGAAPSFLLAPRFAQPARLLFAWIAADGSGGVETSTDPATTPVCGWVALNRVDETIFFFLADGTLIGWIAAANGAITYLPGHSAADVTDPWLVQAIARIASDAQGFYDDVDTALLTIEPRAHLQHAARSVLESRPLALARAELGLQLKGAPRPHQGYEALATLAIDDDGNLPTGPAPSPFVVRETCGFEKVAVPVRLGDVSMDDDGLVAYWTIAGKDIAAQYSLVSNQGEADAEPVVLLAPGDAAPSQVLLLLDPRASVHATSGMLPVGTIAIPDAMFSAALGEMDFVMQVAPLVTPADQVAMPIPAETNGTWAWLVDEGSQWSDPVAPAQTDAMAHPATAPAVLRAGYLQTR